MLFQGDLVTSDRILYTPSSFAKTNLLHLQECGSLKAESAHTSKREHLASYLFFIVISGSGSLFYNGKTYPLSSGDGVFIDCRKTYYHSTSDDLWSLMWVHFNGPTMNGIYNKYIERGGLPTFKLSRLNEYKQIINDIHTQAAGTNYIKDMLINQQLSLLLTYLMEDNWHLNTTSTSTKQKSLQPIKDYIEKNYTQQISLDQLSTDFYINKFYLTRLFKEHYGISINSYIQHLRITNAKHYLRFTDKSMDEIANLIGYHDANYFARQFKQVESISPSEYRKQWSRNH